MSSTKYKNNRIEIVDILKSICIFYIVGYWHLFNYTKAFPQYSNMITARLTVIVLGLFVLMSGYLIGSKNIFFNKDDIVYFYKSKFIRIYPPFILSAIIFFLSKKYDVVALLKTAFPLSIFIPPSLHTLWFVEMIIFFYIIGPFLINSVNDYKKYIIFLIYFFCFMSVYFFSLNVIDMRIIIYFPVFYFGIFLSVDRNFIYKYKIHTIVIFFIISIIFSFYCYSDVEHAFSSMPIAIVGPFLFFFLLSKSRVCIAWNNFFAFVSYASFFMYLFHRQIFKFLCDLYFPNSLFSQTLYLYLFCLPIIVIMSWLGQKIYDKIIVYRLKILILNQK